MPLWPFKKRRSGATPKETSSPPTTDPNIQPTTPTRRPSKRFAQRLRRASQQTEKTPEKQSPDQKAQPQQQPTPQSAEQHTDQSTSRPRGSIEDITALPVSWNLESSPHLRPIDMERPQIPYNFRDHATSQSSIQRSEARPPSRPATVRSKRSAIESMPVRRNSSKKRKEDDRVREEEIRAMSASGPVPKRSTEGLFRRDSKKRRNMKSSAVSLPYGESIHSMSTVPEQRGWELGAFDVFNPRPAIRLS